MNRKDDVIGVISKPPGGRRDYEVDAILPWLRKKSQLLQTLEKSVLMDLIKNCEFKQSKKDEVVIRQGDKGDCFYIILEGCVSIYIDSKLSGEDEIAVTPAPAQEGEEEAPTVTTPDPVAKSPDKEPRGKSKTLDRSRYGRFIIKFNAGKSFGEIALISEDCVRNATIIVDERTEFLVINKDLFDRCLKAFQEKEYAAVQNFVNNHEFFRRWHPRLKRLLEMSLRKESFVYDSVIVKQGDPVTGLNFIKHGQAMVTIQPSKHRKQYNRMWPFEAVTDMYANEFEWLREPRKNAILRKFQDPAVLPTRVEPVAVKRSMGYVAAEKFARDKSVTLCNIHDNEVMGDIETVLNLGTYMQTVTCSANTEIFILDHKNFDRLIVKRSPATLKIIRDHVEAKLRSRNESMQGHQIPLLGYLAFKMEVSRRPTVRKLPPLVTAKSLPDEESLTQHMIDRFIAGKAELVEPHVKGSLFIKDLMHEKARIRESIRQNIANKSKQFKRQSLQPKRKPRSLLALRQALEDMIDEDMVAWREAQPKQRRRRSRPSVGSINDDRRMSQFEHTHPTPNSRLGYSYSRRESQMSGFGEMVNGELRDTSRMSNRLDEAGEVSAADAWFQGSMPAYLRGNHESPEDLDLGLALKNISPKLKNRTNVSPQPVNHNSQLSTDDKSGSTSGAVTVEKVDTSKVSTRATISTDPEKSQTARRKGSHSDNKVTDGLHLPSITEEGIPDDELSDDRNIEKSPITYTKPSSDNVNSRDNKKHDANNVNDTLLSHIDVQDNNNLLPNHINANDNTKLLKDKINNKPDTRHDPRGIQSNLGLHDDNIDQVGFIDESEELLDLEVCDSRSPRKNDRSPRKLDHISPRKHEDISTSGTYLKTGNEYDKNGKWREATEHIIKTSIHEDIRRRAVFDRLDNNNELESGDSSLSLLESRLKAFHIKMGHVSNRRSGKLPKLRRYQAEEREGYSRLRPGGKVCVQRRACELRHCKYHIKGHEHVRYHITSSVPQLDDANKTRAVVQTRMESVSHSNE